MMKRWGSLFGGLLFCLLGAAAARAQIPCNALPFPSVTSPSNVNANFAALYGCTVNNLTSAQVADNVSLSSLATLGYPKGIWRNDYSAGWGAGPSFWAPQTGTCASNGWTNDGGHCVDTVGGNSWLSYIPPAGLNVLQFGADRKGSADSTTAFSNAVTALSQNGGKVLAPPGSYLIATGPVTVTIQGVTIEGMNTYQPSALTAGGADVSVVSMSARQDKLANLTVQGSNHPNTTHAAILFNNGCLECTLDKVSVQYGYQGLYANNGEAYIFDSVMTQAYATSLIYMTCVSPCPAGNSTGGYIRRVKLDQGYVGSCAANNSYNNTSIGAWAANSSVAVCKIVSTGGYYLQATNGGAGVGTSISGSAPTPPPYGNTVAEVGPCNGGTCAVWALLAPVTYDAVTCDTGCGADLVISDTDMTGPFQHSFRMLNSQSATAPSLVHISQITASQTIGNTIELAAGNTVTISGSTIGACLLSGCDGVAAESGFGGDLSVTNNIIVAAQNCLAIIGGIGTTWTGGICGGTVNGLATASGMTNWAVNNVSFGSKKWGGLSGSGLNISTSNDWYTGIGNIMNTASNSCGTGVACVATAITDNSNGAHSLLMNAGVGISVGGVAGVSAGPGATTGGNTTKFGITTVQ